MVGEILKGVFRVLSFGEASDALEVDLPQPRSLVPINQVVTLYRDGHPVDPVIDGEVIGCYDENEYGNYVDRHSGRVRVSVRAEAPRRQYQGWVQDFADEWGYADGRDQVLGVMEKMRRDGVRFTRKEAIEAAQTVRWRCRPGQERMEFSDPSDYSDTAVERSLMLAGLDPPISGQASGNRDYSNGGWGNGDVSLNGAWS